MSSQRLNTLTKHLNILGLIVSCLAFCQFLGANQKPSSPEEYVFFSPSMISSYLNSYNDQEKQDIEKDLVIVRNVCSHPKKDDQQKQFYLATAGGPGARKSTILERFLSKHPEFLNGVYLDPDQRALRFMVNTYYNHSLNALTTAEQEDYSNVRKQAYEKWRGASNYITYTLIEETLQARKPMIHGATSTGEHIEALFKKLKQIGYDITLLLCSCEDAVRSQAVTYRNTVQRFYQSTPEDALTKGKNFPLRMSVYFSLADTLYLIWSDSLFQPERLAAVLQDGKIKVVDQQALKLFVKKFEKDRDILTKQGVDIPSWDDLLTMYKFRHTPASN